jgi:glucose/mannose transport system permease protein
MIQKTRTNRFLIYGSLFFLSVLFLIPAYMLIITAFKSPDQINMDTVWSLPNPWYWQSFAEAWEAFAPNLLNSLSLVIPSTIISAMLGSINGYVLSKWKFPGANIIFPLMLFGMFIPYQSILIPLFQFLNRIGLYGNIPGLILVHVIYGIPITTLIFRNYYAAIPTELVEAARIDGANIFGIYRHVLFPLSAPGFVVVLIWQFTSIWNDFLFAVTMVGNPEVQPITVALNNLAGSLIVEWNVQMAGALLAALPTLLVYIFLGRYFMSGLMAGSLKG